MLCIQVCSFFRLSADPSLESADSHALLEVFHAIAFPSSAIAISLRCDAVDCAAPTSLSWRLALTQRARLDLSGLHAIFRLLIVVRPGRSTSPSSALPVKAVLVISTISRGCDNSPSRQWETTLQVSSTSPIAQQIVSHVEQHSLCPDAAFAPRQRRHLLSVASHGNLSFEICGRFRPLSFDASAWWLFAHRNCSVRVVLCDEMSVVG